MNQNDNQGRGPHPAQPSGADFILAVAWALYAWFVVAGLYQVGMDVGWW